MTTATTVSLPRPSSDDEFESLATDVLKLRWRTPTVTRFGRRGQEQHGIDATATPPHLVGALAGAQYKNVASLTIADINAEVAKTESFPSSLAEYTIVTSLPRDARLAEQVLALSQQRRASNQFPVQILFWDDLRDDLAGDLELVRKYYPWIFVDHTRVVVEHRAIVLPSPTEIRPFVNWETFYVLPKDEGPRSPTFLKLVAVPHDPLALNIDGDLLDEFRSQVERRFGHAAPFPPRRARIDALELMWRHPHNGISRHWMRGMDGSVGFATTIESVWCPGSVSLWEVALDTLLFFQMTRDVLGGFTVDVGMSFHPGNLIPTPAPLSNQDRDKPDLGGISRTLQPASIEANYGRVDEQFSPDDQVCPFEKLAGMLVHRWRVMFGEPGLRIRSLSGALADLARSELRWNTSM
jgi:hypothetical protein